MSARVFVTGDMHGCQSSIIRLYKDNFPVGETLTKDDVVIILGDFGFIWDDSKEEHYWLKWLSERKWTTMFIDGNHENFDLLYEYPIEYKNSNLLRKINNSVYHIPRGTVLKIGEKNLFCFGGAESIDKPTRIEGVSWWSDEVPTVAEMMKGFETFINNKVSINYILTHTCPFSILEKICNVNILSNTVEKYLENIYSNSSNITWYFGHMHIDRDFGNIAGVYKNIIELKS